MPPNHRLTKVNVHDARTAVRYRSLWVASLLAAGGLFLQRVEISEFLVMTLEQRISRVEVSDWKTVKGLVVPCGAPSRVTEAMRLARSHPHLRVHLSGPGDEEKEIATGSEGIAHSRVVIETQSLNTFGNAKFAKDIIRPEVTDVWLLVTSASHMPRALGSFQRVKFSVLPWPVEDRPASWTAQATIAWHEWVGLIVYRLRGWTTAFLPINPSTGSYADTERQKNRNLWP
jgi:uncharacterized SAM-binding protein YcdF (DUF218 family)